MNFTYMNLDRNRLDFRTHLQCMTNANVQRVRVQVIVFTNKVVQALEYVLPCGCLFKIDSEAIECE